MQSTKLERTAKWVKYLSAPPKGKSKKEAAPAPAAAEPAAEPEAEPEA